MDAVMTKSRTRLRFDVGAQVRVRRAGVIGVITALDSSPTALGEYWHTFSPNAVREESQAATLN